MRSRSAAMFDHGNPIATLGLAPFAGLLLTMVLLFAALRPPVTHALVVDLPQPFEAFDDEVGPIASNRLSIDREGALIWNGTSVTDSRLRALLADSRTEIPQPLLLFEPDANATYGRVVEVMGIVADEGLIEYNFCFSGLGDHRQFDKPWSNRRMHLTSLFLTDRGISEFTGFDLPPTYCPDAEIPSLD